MARPLTEEIVDDLTDAPADVALTPPRECYNCGAEVDEPAAEYEYNDELTIEVDVCDQCWHMKMNDDEREHIGLL
jgi:hypothetical protein